MDEQIRLLIHKKKSIYDDIAISLKCSCKYEAFSKQIKSQNETIYNDCTQRKQFHAMPLCKKGFNAYLVSIYIYTINSSDTYRKSAIDVLKYFIRSIVSNVNVSLVIALKLRTPKYQFLDYNWNGRITRMVMERVEIDHAMSWLSTLGGAFSALGDQFDHCAKVAGKISLEQFKLSMRLGDPELVARCKLYAALSLLQQGYLKTSRKMIKEIFKFAIVEKDIRLQRMCQGVWAKLKYTYSKRHKS